MSSSSRDSLYLEHIAERIRRIEDAAENGRDAFESSCILQDAIIRNFENLFGGWIRCRDTVVDVHERRSNEPCSGATGRV